jgi:uncharacterized protein DUF3971/AsmA-like protein
MLFRHVQRATSIITAIIAAVLFFAGGAALRLAMGPVSLGAFSQPVAEALNRSVSGAVIRFDEVVLEWSRVDQRINLIVLGTRIFDLDGHIVAQAPKAELNFDAVALLSGHLRLKNFGLIGLQLTGMRTQAGAIRLGFGRDQTEPNFLDALRDILRSSSSQERGLESVSLQHARVAFLDEPTGLFIVLPDTSFALTANRNGFDASLGASAEISGSPFRIDLRAALQNDGTPKSAVLKLGGFSLRSLAESSPKFAKLKPYRLVTDLSANLAFKDGTLGAIAFRATGAGSVDVPAIGHDLRLSRFDVDGNVDPQKQHIEAQTVSFEANRGSPRGRGTFVLDWDNSGINQASGEVDASGLQFTFPNLFQQPVAFSHLSFHLNYSRNERQISWEHSLIESGPLSADVSGTARLDDTGLQDVNLSATVAPLAVSDLLTFWPEEVAQGARDWVAANISDGRIGPLRIDAALPPGALDAPLLPDSALNVTFPFQGLTSQYVQGMTPITGANGMAVLRGDSFQLTVNNGSIGPISLTNGEITIPELHVPGTTAHITAHADGTTADILRLIDEQPLGYPKRFGIVPATVEGRSAVDLDFQLPLLKDLPWDRVQFLIRANASQLGLPVAQRKLEGAAVQFIVNPSSLTAKGRGRFATVPVEFQWTEDFEAAANSTRLDVSGRANDAERARLGVILPSWITGPVPFSLKLAGEHFRFAEGQLSGNLTNIAADFPGLAVKKPAGVPATGSAQLAFDSAGVVSIPDFTAISDNLKVQGAVVMGEGGKLRTLSLSQFQSGADDFALTLIPSAKGMNVAIQGQSLDVKHLTGLDRTAISVAESQDSGPQDPISVTAQVQRLILSQRATLRNVALSIAFERNNRLGIFDLQSDTPGLGKLTGHMTVVKGIRNLNMEAENAGAVIDSLLNFSSVKGGTLSAQIAFPEPGFALVLKNTPKPDYEGTVTLSNILLTDQPFLARLFAAGSLDGPLRLLQGEGISLSNAVIPFNARGRVITIGNGRASGGAIGGTFTGMYDRDTRKVAISGTLVPIFGLNSVLGAIPVLGDVLVSKKGEGILGLTYEMKGDIAEPAINVNPLSILTPGILRRIFEFGPSQTATTAPPASK